MHRFDDNDSTGSTRIGKWREYLLAVLGAGLLSVVAPAGLADASRPVAVDPSYCIKIAVDGARPDNARCPSFMADGLADSARDCREVGGRLTGASQGSVRALDIDGDRRPEYLYRFDANFSCEGAPSYFSCGSSECPWSLFRRQNGGWQHLGYFSATDLAPVAGTGAAGFPDLQMTCEDLSFCDTALYRWDGTTYNRVEMVLRGARVQLFDSSTLSSPLRRVAVLAQPKAGSQSLGEYGTEAIFAVMGRVQDGDWRLVSPCNACESGFVQARDLGKK